VQEPNLKSYKREISGVAFPVEYEPLDIRLESSIADAKTFIELFLSIGV
jgi:hypothetical protein